MSTLTLAEMGEIVERATMELEDDRTVIRELRAALATAEAETARLRDALTAISDMADNCAGVSRQPDSLPMMVVAAASAALKAPTP